MNKHLLVLAALLLAPALASADFNGHYGNRCTPNEIRAHKCDKSGHKLPPPVAQGEKTLGPQDGVPGAPGVAGPQGTATAMQGGAGNVAPGGGIPGGADPAAAAAALAGLKSSAPGPDGKCANGGTPVPGLNGTTSCINMGGK